MKKYFEVYKREEYGNILCGIGYVEDKVIEIFTNNGHTSISFEDVDTTDEYEILELVNYYTGIGADDLRISKQWGKPLINSAAWTSPYR